MPVEWFRRVAAVGLTGALALAAALLLARRLAGAFLEPLPIALLIVAGLFVSAVTIEILRLIARESERSRKFAAIVCAASMPIVAFALSVPDSNPFGLAVLWVAVAVAELAVWQFEFKKRPRHAPDATTTTSIARLSKRPLQIGERAATEWRDRAISQQLNYHNSKGRVAVDGWLRIRFDRDQRTAIAHVAFCPAFERIPNVDAECLDGPLGNIRTTLALPWGVRWEIRLEAPADEPLDLILGFVATETAPVSPSIGI